MLLNLPLASLWKLPNIAVPSDPLFYIGPFPVFNTFILTVVSALIVLGFFLAAARKARLVPRPLQNFVEWVTQMLLDLCEEVAGKRNGRRFFPWVATIFFLVLISNWWEVIPGVETIGTVSSKTADGTPIKDCPTAVHGLLLTGSHASNCLIPWVRPPSTDLNFTLALAVISFLATQVYGFKLLGVGKQLGRYFTLKEGPMGLIVGLLELALEPLRIVSLSFRLFGNLFAGDVLLLVISFLVPFVGAIPFYALELFVGFIQAFVFAFLTLIFMTLGTTVHGHEEHEVEHAEEAAHAEREHAAFVLAHKEEVAGA
ncbi:MAG TPA: FoF1 ATP synthase subunit a [Ktedonobacterales bacterium]|nr:FoF1 ATP synthase subunit a [Ktedonobacterales bacterium]